MHSLAPSLTDQPAESPFAQGVAWVQAAALGSTATVVAVVAVAAVGLLMLSGRLELRRGITVVIGCFLLFGAPTIAAALTGFNKQSDPRPAPARDDDADRLSQQSRSPDPKPSAYDPYAGASVPTAR